VSNKSSGRHCGRRRSKVDIRYTLFRWAMGIILYRPLFVHAYLQTHSRGRILRWEFIFVRDISYYVRICSSL
jgi:hypothetical protein